MRTIRTTPAAIAAFYTADAAEIFEKESAGGSACGREAVEHRYAAHFASNPSKLSLKLVEVYTIGDDVCAVSEFSPRFRSGKGHHVLIFVHEADDWKIRMAYTN